MKRNYLSTLFLALVLSVMSVNAQEENTENELSLTKGTIENQFEYIFQKSNSFEDYKVVKKTWLSLLKKNILDSVSKIENDLVSVSSTSLTQKSEIEKLKTDLAGINTQLTNVTNEKDSISLFGAVLSKPTYKVTMWGIIIVLAAVLLLFIYKFKGANTITETSRKALNDLENEYEEYKRKALEREQKARRQLQDELNKQKLAKAK